MRATVVRPAELGPAECALWDSFARDSSLGSPFLSWRFARVIDGARDDARIVVYEDGPDICGFLAFQVGPDAEGRPIGATIGDAQGVVGRPGWAFDARELIDAAGLRGWHFDHLVTSQVPFVPYHRQLHRSPLVELGGGHDRFLEEVRSHSRDLLAQVGRRRRKLEREVGPVRCEWHSTRPDRDMQLLEQWKSDQYAQEGSWDRFAHPWISQALRCLSRSHDSGCTGVLTVLRAGERTVAVHLGLLGFDRLSWWFPAYDPEFGRYSPGLILLLDLIAQASERAVRLVDLGRGEHHYKLRVTARFYEVAEGYVDAVRRAQSSAGWVIPAGRIIAG